MWQKRRTHFATGAQMNKKMNLFISQWTFAHSDELHVTGSRAFSAMIAKTRSTSIPTP